MRGGRRRGRWPLTGSLRPAVPRSSCRSTLSKQMRQGCNVSFRQLGTCRRTCSGPLCVESRCGAVAVGRTYLFPPLSSGGALVVRP